MTSRQQPISHAQGTGKSLPWSEYFQDFKLQGFSSQLTQPYLTTDKGGNTAWPSLCFLQFSWWRVLFTSCQHPCCGQMLVPPTTQPLRSKSPASKDPEEWLGIFMSKLCLLTVTMMAVYGFGPTIVNGGPLCFAFLKVVTTISSLPDMLFNDSTPRPSSSTTSTCYRQHVGISKVMGSTFRPLRSKLRGFNQPKNRLK